MQTLRNAEGGRVTDVNDVQLARMFAALSNSVRLQMLRQLRRESHVCACGFDVQTSVAQSTVSHHLRILREAGLVRADRSGTFINYSLEPDAFEVTVRASIRLLQQPGTPPAGSELPEADGPS